MRPAAAVPAENNGVTGGVQPALAMGWDAGSQLYQ